MLHLTAVGSLVLAFTARVSGTEAWADLFPISLVELLLAVWLRPRLYRLIQQHSKATSKLGKTVILASGALLGSLLIRLTTTAISQATHSQDLPFTVWLMDLLLNFLLALVVFAYTPAGTFPDKQPLHLWAAFALIFLFGLALVWKSLQYPMTWDDLHLIRYFSLDHLRASWAGNWEPDLIETRGYRPLTMAFNHFRYVFFREDVVLHRVFLVSLYALFLTQVIAIAQRFGLSWKMATFAGLLAFSARHSVYHYVWLADGIHVFQAVMVSQALLFLLKAIDRRQTIYFVYSLVFALGALLVREDNLVVVPFACLLGVASLWPLRPPRQMQMATLVYLFALAAGAVGIYLMRSLFVDTEPVTINLLRMLNTVRLTLFGFLGEQSFDPASQLAIGLWPFFLASCALLLLAAFKLGGWRQPLLWLLATLAACLVGLTNDRANLLIFSTTAFSLAIASLLDGYQFRGRVWQVALSSLAVLLLLASSHSSHTASQAFHPFASNVIYWNTEFVYGRFAHKATIPEERLAGTIQRLAQVNITGADIPLSYQDYLDPPNQDTFSQMARQARDGQLRRPGPNGQLFVPWLEPFSR